MVKVNAIIKRPFGTPVKCEYVVTRNDDETFDEFRFSSKRRESGNFRVDSLKRYEGGVHNFSKKITSMIVEKKHKLIALYLTLLPHSVGFVHHREGLHTAEGFLVDRDDDLPIDELVENGGTKEDYEEFVRFANESATVVEPGLIGAGGHQDISSFFVKKRQSGESEPKPLKKTKSAAIDDNETKELEDPEGIEKEYSESIVGMANISLDNLSIPKELNVKVNPFRVCKIKESMIKRYDPSLSIPVVCPVDAKESVNLKDVKGRHFLVVQKTV